MAAARHDAKMPLSPCPKLKGWTVRS